MSSEQHSCNQAMRQQIGDPSGITHLRLTAWHIADVLRVGKHELEVTCQQMPDRFPVHPRRLHGDMGDSVLAQPFDKRPLGGQPWRPALS